MTRRRKKSWYHFHLERYKEKARASILSQYEPLFKLARDEIALADSKIRILKTKEPFISQILRIFCFNSKWWEVNLAKPIRELDELRKGFEKINNEYKTKVLESDANIARSYHEASLKRIRDKEIEEIVRKTVERAEKMADLGRSQILRNQCGYLKRLMVHKECDEFGFVICFYCNTKILSTDCHLEHKVPISRGGDNSSDNLVLACAPCNLSKGTKTHVEFLMSMRKN